MSDTPVTTPCALPPRDASQSQRVCYIGACAQYQAAQFTCNLISDETLQDACLQQAEIDYFGDLSACNLV